MALFKVGLSVVCVSAPAFAQSRADSGPSGGGEWAQSSGKASESKQDSHTGRTARSGETADGSGPPSPPDGGRSRPQGGADPPSAEAPRQSDAAELDQVIELYMAGQYERCTARLSVFLDPKGDSPFREAGIIELGRLYYASCSLLVGRRDQARRALRAALEANPLMQAPDSLTFPPPVVSLFLEVRDEVEQLIAKREQEQLEQLQREAEAREERALARKRREAELYRLAMEETVVVESSRMIASLPFGAGQFQSGKTALGWTFLLSETLLAGTALASGVYYSELRAQGSAAGAKANGPLQTSYEIMGVSSIALLSVMALGIAEAHWTFQKERIVRIRRRALPPELREAPGSDDPPQERAAPEDPTFAPRVEVGPLGAQFSVVGRF